MRIVDKFLPDVIYSGAEVCGVLGFDGDSLCKIYNEGLLFGRYFGRKKIKNDPDKWRFLGQNILRYLETSTRLKNVTWDEFFNGYLTIYQVALKLDIPVNMTYQLFKDEITVYTVSDEKLKREKILAAPSNYSALIWFKKDDIGRWVSIDG